MNEFHFFDKPPVAEDLPVRLNSPFNYAPHPLAVAAAMHVRRHIASVQQLDDELGHGKMLGVLVVKTQDGQCGFLAAYSGSLQQPLLARPYFVPPVFDLLDAQGYFKREEGAITNINAEIAAIEGSPQLAQARAVAIQINSEAKTAIALYKQEMATAKARRDALRKLGNTDDKALIAESQHQKAELKRLRKAWDEKVETAIQQVAVIENSIETLKKLRRQRSEALQQWIFGQFSMLNARGERRNLLEIFASTPQRIPPAGAGECAAPRLLQFAFMHRLQPLAIAEFWYGQPQSGLVRHDGNFYTACRGKCLPILSFMLQGIDMEIDPPHIVQTCSMASIIYEDQWIIAAAKPAGMPSVPGRNCGLSLLEWLASKYAPHSPMAVHRLDMDTSGIVVFARDKDTHRLLQAMFARHKIQKRYVAMLDGIVAVDSGVIDLPLRPDYEHRPMQVVDYKNGYPAVTRYDVVERYPQQGKTLVHFYPITGRTHQLRLHAAHHAGLNAPIAGDRLYGKGSNAATRLMLHADRLAFRHPHTGKQIVLQIPLPPGFGRT